MKYFKCFCLSLYLLVSFLSAFSLLSQSGWVQQNSGINSNITYIQAIDANNAFLGNPGYKTTNGGATWFLASSQSFLEVQMINALTGYAVKDYLYKTTNGGINWNIITIDAPLYSQISFINENTGIVGGLHDMDLLGLFKTTNGGANWNWYIVASYPWPDYITEFTELKMVNANVMYVSFYLFQELYPPLWNINYFQKSTNGGNSFNTMMWDSNYVYYDPEFPLPNTGFVIMAKPGSYNIIKSVNDNWGATISLTTPYLISGIDFPSVNTGYAVCAGGIIHKTTNGGINWYTLNSGTARHFSDVKFINELTGWVVGDSGIILKTTTGGELPKSVSGIVKFSDNNQPVSSGYVKALSYDSASHSIISLDSAQIQPNGSYLLPNCPPVYIDIMAYENDEEELSFVPTYHLSSVSWQGSVKVKPDSNLTNIDIGVKRILNNGGMMKIAGYIYSNYILDYTGLQDAVIYAKSGDNYKGYSISLSSGYYCIDSLPAGIYSLFVDRMGCVSAENTVQLVNSNLENVNFFLEDYIVPVFTQTHEIPRKFDLLQNYPNPFNPVTNIEFAVPKSSNVKLIIYNIQGKQVETIVNGELGAGTYKVEWNASNYPSGVYFYKIQTDEFIATRKMILVK